jgi:broad specificity phosphatase PhoE
MVGSGLRIRRLAWLLRGALLVLALLLPSLAAAQEAGGTTVIVVRHAERADDGTERDPELSAAGHARAEALADALADAGVGAIYVTQFRRTQQTAAPLAARLGVQATVLQIESGGVDAYVGELRGRLTGGVVLVVGHNNTVPAIAAALSGVAVPAMPSAEYATMYIITLPADGSPALVRARYGAPDPTDGGTR